MAGLQNAMKIVVLCCTGNPIWRPETRIRDWNFAKNLVGLLNRVEMLQGIIFSCGFQQFWWSDTTNDITQYLWWWDITNNSRWRPTNRKQSTLYSGCHVEFHIDFDEITGQSILHCDGDPWKHGSSIWNHVSTCYRSKVITTSGFAAAILIYVHDYTKNWSHFNPIGSARLDYVEIGRKTVVITATNAEIQTFPFFRLFGRHLGFAAERHGLQNRRHHH